MVEDEIRGEYISMESLAFLRVIKHPLSIEILTLDMWFV